MGNHMTKKGEEKQHYSYYYSKTDGASSIVADSTPSTYADTLKGIIDSQLGGWTGMEGVLVRPYEGERGRERKGIRTSRRLGVMALSRVNSLAPDTVMAFLGFS